MKHISHKNQEANGYKADTYAVRESSHKLERLKMVLQACHIFHLDKL